MSSGGRGVPVHPPNCYGCGPANAQGLGLRMQIQDDLAVHGEIVFAPHFEGGPGLVHGGAVAAALDDLLGAVPTAHRLPAVTANLNVTFRAPVVLGTTVRLEASLDRRDGRKLHLAGRMRTPAGVLLAEATALFLVVDLEHFRQAGRPIPDAWAGWPSDARAVAP